MHSIQRRVECPAVRFDNRRAEGYHGDRFIADKLLQQRPQLAQSQRPWRGVSCGLKWGNGVL